MNKLIQKLINWLWANFSDDGKSINESLDHYNVILQKQLQQLQPIKYKYDVLTLIERLESAGWHKIGTERNANQEIWMFDTVDQSIQVHIHNEGDLYRIYRQVNDMNINSLIARLINPNRHLERAKETLNQLIMLMNNGKEISTEQYSENINRAMAALMAME